MGLEQELERTLNKYWFIPPTRTAEMLWCSVLLRAMDDSSFEWLDARRLWHLRKRKTKMSHSEWCDRLRLQAMQAQRLRAEARMWIEDAATEQGSLFWICDVLGIPYQRTRRILRVLNAKGERRYRRWLDYIAKVKQTGGLLDA